MSTSGLYKYIGVHNCGEREREEGRREKRDEMDGGRQGDSLSRFNID